MSGQEISSTRLVTTLTIVPEHPLKKSLSILRWNDSPSQIQDQTPMLRLVNMLVIPKSLQRTWYEVYSNVGVTRKQERILHLLFSVQEYSEIQRSLVEQASHTKYLFHGRVPLIMRKVGIKIESSGL